MLLSICIPNFNRSRCLNNCLNSILISKENSNIKFEVCISDNCSGENIEKVVENYSKNLDIKFKKNQKNFGLGKNFLSAVSMAQGDYVWLLGNDDLILPETLKKMEKLINENKNLDFFFINSFNLSSDIVFKSSQPFDTRNLPKNMERFSKSRQDKIINFFELIDPKISFDFLLGAYLSVFRRKKWEANIDVINKKDLEKEGTYSTFDNTCPHVKIFSKAFSKSKAYVNSEPLSVNLFGEREWSDLYPFVEAIRIPQALDCYLKNGMSKKRYFYCKNYSLKNFLPSVIKIILLGKKGGINYIKFKSNILRNLIYPNFYLSPINFFLRKIFKAIN
tara:strand:+ start:120 stop:1121 length:1002 start_codon:yes stop_codon:yes gene_type:complete